MLPQRQSGSVQTVARASGSTPVSQPPTFQAIKARVVAKLEDRLNPAASKRMPSSVLRQSLRTHAEQIAEQEGGRLTKADRERLVDEALAEILGYGPLDELFRDPAVREVLVAGPQAILVRRDTAGWLPAGVRFRDDAHLRSALDRPATHADPVGGVTASVNLFDLKLPNGFRAVAVIPPDALGQPPSIAFVRMEANPPALAAEPVGSPSGRQLNSTTTRKNTTTRPPSGPAATEPPRPDSGSHGTPLPRPSPLELTPAAQYDPLTRHRKPITEWLIAKLASRGVYDAQRINLPELQKVIAAYIAEYCAKERINLSDDDQGRLMLEILTTIQR
jgi:hypothetical protein